MDQKEFEEMADIGERPAGSLDPVLIRPAEGSVGGTSDINYFYDNDTGAIHVGAHNDHNPVPRFDGYEPDDFHDNDCC